jgi:hypothetical protein
MRALAGLGRRIANTGKDDASERQGKTGQEQGSEFHFTVSFSVSPLFVPMWNMWNMTQAERRS